MARMPSPTARVALFTRPGCHLCDDARPVVEAVCRRTGDSWTEHDVDADERLRRLYTDKVPVVTVDGTVVDFWRVDERRLQDRLATRR
jgi:glutaredoxin